MWIFVSGVSVGQFLRGVLEKELCGNHRNEVSSTDAESRRGHVCENGAVHVRAHRTARARAHTHTHTHTHTQTGILIGKMLNPPGAWYKRILRECQLNDLRRKAEDSPGWMDDVVINIKLAWFQNEWLKAVTYLTLWVSVGVMYGMFSSQRMRFLTAVYFAVTCTCSPPTLFPFHVSYARGPLVCVRTCVHPHHVHITKTGPPERKCIRILEAVRIPSQCCMSTRDFLEARTHVHAACNRSLLSQRLVWRG